MSDPHVTMYLPIGFSLPIVGIGIFCVIITCVLCCYLWRLRREGQEEMGYKNVVYKSMSDTKNDTCAVCLEDFSHKEHIAMCPCHHGYHTKCLTEWLHQHTTCPMCKVQVRVNERTRLTTAMSQL